MLLTAYPSRAPGFTLDFWWCSLCSSLKFSALSCFGFFRPVSCVHGFLLILQILQILIFCHILISSRGTLTGQIIHIQYNFQIFRYSWMPHAACMYNLKISTLKNQYCYSLDLMSINYAYCSNIYRNFQLYINTHLWLFVFYL
jgi:hypothetical protein